MHEKLHSGFLEIPVNLIKGNYQSFLNEYGSYIDEDDWSIINERKSITNSTINWKKDEYPGIKKSSNIEENDSGGFCTEPVDKEILELVDKIQGVG